MLDIVIKTIENFIVGIQNEESQKSIETILAEGEELQEDFKEMFDKAKESLQELYGIGEEAANHLVVIILEAENIRQQLQFSRGMAAEHITREHVFDVVSFRNYVLQEVDYKTSIPF